MHNWEEMNSDTKKSLLLRLKNRLYLHQQQMLNGRVIKPLSLCLLLCFCGVVMQESRSLLLPFPQLL